MLPVKEELIENARRNHNLWFRVFMSKAGISYRILKALPNGGSEMKLENKSTARIARFLTKLTWSRSWLLWTCCHPFMISRSVRRRKHPSRFWSCVSGILWPVPEWIIDSLPHCSPACVGKPNHYRAWGESQLGGMCTVLQRNKCISFKSWKETKKNPTGWGPDWPFRLRSTFQIKSPSTNFLHYFWLHPRKLLHCFLQTATMNIILFQMKMPDVFFLCS